MNETWLRWKGRLGSSKWIAAFVALGALVLLIVAVNSLRLAWDSRRDLQAVTVGQLIRGEIGPDRYVAVSGWAFYDIGFQIVDLSGPIVEYYFLHAESSGELVLVRAEGVRLARSGSEYTTITGMTRNAPLGLRDKLESIVADLRDAGLETIPTLYIAEGATPSVPRGSVVVAVLLGLLLAVSLFALFCPRRVFAPGKIRTAPAPLEGASTVQCIGRFRRLRGTYPSFEYARGSRKLEDIAANVELLSGGRLLVYVHHIGSFKEARSFVRGSTIEGGARETRRDWGVLIDANRILSIEPGKIYGWGDIPAARLQHQEEDGKTRTLYFTFDHDSAQAAFVERFRQMGFVISEPVC